MKNEKGITLVELMITLAIFSIVIAGVYAAYVTQIKHGIREYRIAESDMELDIAKSVIERDMAMAGYGFADDYAGAVATTIMPVSATDGTPDTLTLRGTATGRGSRASQAWSYMVSTTQFKTWTDGRENLRGGDRVVYIEPTQKKIQKSGTDWEFTVHNTLPTTTTLPTDDPTGHLIYGVSTVALTTPLNSVRYNLGGTSPSMCATGTHSLLRAESNTAFSPASGDPLLACVLDFQVAFGLDTNEDKTIDCWDNGGATAAGYDLSTLKTRVKQIRAYALLQIGNRDPDYTFPASSKRVGDENLTACGAAGGVGRNSTLDAEQRKYRWRVITFNITPRNLR